MKIDTVAKINLETKTLEISFGSKVVIVGGENDPSPSELFCAGLISCTAAVAYNYCMHHDLPLPLELGTSFLVDEKTGNVVTVDLKIQVPDEFPDNRIKALEKAASTCDVEQAWLNPPKFCMEVTKARLA